MDNQISCFLNQPLCNLKLVLSYDGTAYLGWQKNQGPSIEKTLQAVLEKILQHPITLQAASRTDAGVHAHFQVANFYTPKTNLELEKVCASINRLLPKDIIIHALQPMPLSFHPSLSTIAKEYRYYICTGARQNPMHRFYSWHVPTRLSVKDMREAISFLIGTRDYTTFCNVKENLMTKNKICTLLSIQILPLEDNRFCIQIKGDRFLYKMVRILVGTLIDIGRARLALHSLPQILEAKKRTSAGVTAPAHGLFLHHIDY